MSENETNENEAAESKSILVDLPAEATDLTSYWKRTISAGRGSGVRYEIKVPKPDFDGDLESQCQELYGKGLEEVIRLGVLAIGHSADDVAKLEMLVVDEGQTYNHDQDYAAEKHIAMQQAFEKAMRGEGRKPRATSEKVQKVKKETEAELIAKFKAAGLLPADFDPSQI